MPLAGAVTGPGGEPVAGASVTAIPLDGSDGFAPLPPVTAGEAGAFAVPGTDPDTPHYLIAAAGDGANRLYGGIMAPSAADRAGRPVSVTLAPAADVAVTLTRPDGTPAAGAELLNWAERDAVTFGGMTAEIAAALGHPWPAADDAGVLPVPDLPAGAEVILAVKAPGLHAQSVAITTPAAGAGPGAVTAALAASGTLAVTFAAPDGVEPPTRGYRLLGQSGRSIDGRIEETVVATVDGRTVTVAHPVGPGQFGGMLSHPDLVITPAIFAADVTADETATVELEATEPAVFTGRFVGPDGAPIADSSPADDAPEGWRQPTLDVIAFSTVGYFAGRDLGFGAGWQPVSWPVDREDVGADGRFRAKAPRAEVKLFANDYGGGVFPVVFEVDAAGGGRDLGDVVLRPLPEVTGTALGADGEPVPGAVVTADGGEFGARFDAVLADADGRFAFTPESVPPAGEDGAHPLKIKAFAPLAPLVGTAELGLKPGEAPAPVAVTLAPGEPPAAPEPKVPPETRDGREFPLSAGDPAPELAAAAGYTRTGEPADPVRLADLRGRWVLLDVRSTWCGNCRVEEPVLDAVAAGFGEKLTVVSVYDVSDTPEKVAAYLADRPGSGPAVRDADDGATVRAYGVDGFPTRVLIDPAGRVRTYGGLRARDLPTTLRSFLLADEGGTDEPQPGLREPGAAPARSR